MQLISKNELNKIKIINYKIAVGIFTPGEKNRSSLSLFEIKLKPSRANSLLTVKSK